MGRGKLSAGVPRLYAGGGSLYTGGGSAGRLVVAAAVSSLCNGRRGIGDGRADDRLHSNIFDNQVPMLEVTELREMSQPSLVLGS